MVDGKKGRGESFRPLPVRMSWEKWIRTERPLPYPVG